MKSISINFMIEKREGHGEDSAPLYVSKDNFYAVGVFDGMGGSGAAMCKSDYGDHTKAYVASRIVKDAVESYINNRSGTTVIDANGIKQITKSRLEQEKKNFPAKASGLRSRLVRDYPTTLALITSQIKDDCSLITSYWAGDSRNYLWNEEGFFQISKDDLDTESDPLENLRNDGALSNCVCADRDFFINHKEFKVTGKYILISATDGCFGYFLTPMHFQNVLLTGLQTSSNEEDWCEFIKREFTKVTGDDVSISICAIGYECFKELKDTFKDSKIEELEEINNIQNKISGLTAKLEQCKALLEDSILHSWEVYKESYLKYFLVPCVLEETSHDDKIFQADNSLPSSSFMQCSEHITDTELAICNDIASKEEGLHTEENKDNTHNVSEDYILVEKGNSPSENKEASIQSSSLEGVTTTIEQDVIAQIRQGISEKHESNLTASLEKKQDEIIDKDGIRKEPSSSSEVKTELSSESVFIEESSNKVFSDKTKVNDNQNYMLFTNLKRVLKNIGAPNELIEMIYSYLNK